MKKLPNRSVQSSIAKLAARGIHTFVILQQYSMRSYESGKYSLQTDGNLKSMLNILEEVQREIDEAKCGVSGEEYTELCKENTFVISIPSYQQIEPGDDAWLINEIDHVRKITEKCSVFWAEIPYGENALDNRSERVNLYDRFRKACPLIGKKTAAITYFEVPSECFEAVLFVCPGSPRPENPLYSMDEVPYFQRCIDVADEVFFFNSNQAVTFGESEKFFEISRMVKIPERVCSVQAFDDMRGVKIYFPYRLTDKDYGFKNLLSLYQFGSDGCIGVTDPNNSLETLELDPRLRRLVKKLDPKRHLEYLFVVLVTNYTFIEWPCRLENTIHMGPIEMYGYLGSASHCSFHYSHGVDEVIQYKEIKRSLIET